MDGSAARDPRFDLSRGCDTIPRAYHEWPARTKKALSTSLDKGIFEDSHLVVHSGSASTEHSVYFARVADEEIGSPFSRRKFQYYRESELMIDHGILVSYSEFTHQYDAEISLSALVSDVHIKVPCFSHRAVGRLLRTTCTPIVSTLSRLRCKTTKYLGSAVPRIGSSTGTHAHRGRYFICLARSEAPLCYPASFDTTGVARYVRRLDQSHGHQDVLVSDARECR